ncbi:MAG: PilT protein domain protein [Verrucomicrobiales bacterium]|nr:PilT protein domain protein [Verrucomicrobiales bacterium]
MVTALDSSVLLDVLLGDERHILKSKAALRQAHREGSLIISETALAEICPVLSEDEISEALADWNLIFVPSSKESAVLAGRMYSAYLKRGGRRERVVPDFLIGAHAQVHAFRLLARDRGFYRDYFKDMKLWDPSV